MPDRTTYELCLSGDSEVDLHDHMMDAIDAASDQNRTTWLTDQDGHRIARIAPVDEIPDDIFETTREGNPDLARLRVRLQDDGASWRRSDLAARLVAKRTETEPVWQAGRLAAIEARLNTIGQRIGSSPLDGESGIIAQLARMEALQQVTARQVEEIHRTLGLERDADGTLVSDTPRLAEVMAGQVEFMYHGLGFCGGGGDDFEDGDDFDPDMDDQATDQAMDDDPLGPPWYGKRDEMAARLTSGDLIMLNRDLLLQVLQDAGLVDGITDRNRYETVWNALRDLAQAKSPAGTPQPDPGPKMTPRDRPVTTEMLADVLSLAGVRVSVHDMLADWTYSQRVLAYDWAVREHLNASDNPVPRVPRPSFIPVRRTPCPECGQTGACTTDCCYWEGR